MYGNKADDIDKVGDNTLLSCLSETGMVKARPRRMQEDLKASVTADTTHDQAT